MDPTDLDGPRLKGPPSLVMPPPSLASPPSEELLPDVPSDEVSKAILPPVEPARAPVAPVTAAEAEPSPTLVPEPEEPKAPAVDPKDLAKMLAKAAAARGKAARGPAAEAPRAPAPPPAAPPENRPPTSRLAAAPPPTRSRPAAEVVAEGSRLAAAPPPVRKKSASEVLDELARHPEPEPTAPVVSAPVEPAPRARPKPATIQIPPPPPRAEGDWVAPLLLQQLPMLAGAHVAKVVVVEDREVQKALWKGHRARFLATGDVGHGLAASAVLHALSSAEAGDLAVARLTTGDRDWLVWVERRTCIAAFPNASLWFNGI